jgi:hypothetical protein
MQDLCFSYNHWVLRFQFSIAGFFDKFNQVRNQAIAILQSITTSKEATKDPRLSMVKNLIERIGGLMTVHVTNLQNRLLAAALEEVDTVIPYLKNTQLISLSAWTSDPASYAKTSQGVTIFADPSENTALIYLDSFWNPERWTMIASYIGNISCDANECLSTDVLWNHALEQIEKLANRIEMDCLYIHHAIDQLFLNRLPWTLPMLSHLELTVNAIRSQYPNILGTVQDNINLLFRQPITYLAVHPNCIKNPTPTECAFMEIQTLLPILLTADRFTLNRVTRLPTFHAGLFSNTWTDIDSDVKYFLSNGQLRFKVTFDMYQCLATGTYDCHICYFTAQPQLPTDSCERALLEGAPTADLYNICPSRQLSGVERAYLVNSSWVFADATPGHIIETCEASTRTLQLPETGIITFDPKCSYKTVDTPIHLQTSFSRSQVEQIAFSLLSNMWQTNGTVTRHLRDYIYHYFIPTTSAAVLLFFIVLSLIYQQVRLRRARLRRQRRAFLMQARNVSVPPASPVQPAIQYAPGIRFL